MWLIYCLMYFPLWEICVCLCCYALLFVHSSFAIILKRKRKQLEKAGYFAIIVLQMYCYIKCAVALPHGAMSWSAVCECGVS